MLTFDRTSMHISDQVPTGQKQFAVSCVLSPQFTDLFDAARVPLEKHKKPQFFLKVCLCEILPKCSL